MKDLRKNAKIPYGYRIMDGKAVIDNEEADKLRTYFSLYMSGLNMAKAAREAGIECSPTTLRNLLKRKEYAGTSYYPAIIDAGYQERLAAEWEKRKGLNPRSDKKRVKKGVIIYMDFRLSDDHTASDIDPASYISSLYQRIRPRVEHKNTNTKANTSTHPE